MAWIKRNLYFVIGGAVALILMGLAGFYLFSKWQRNNAAMQELEADFSELQRLNSENPHPGSGTVDNIAEAQKQQREARATINKLRKYYEPIAPIPQTPDFPKVSDRDFSAALSRTIDQLQRAAASASVTLPPSYSFSFEAQRPRVTFAPGSTTQLAIQLGEVKAIADVLINAKVNSIDSLRRERVSTDDMMGPPNDYIDLRSVTNELAVQTPYEVSFRCFSSELAAVLGGFAASPQAILVKSVNVEPASGTNVFMDMGMGYPGGYPPGGAAGYAPPGAPPTMAAEAEMARRYGGAGGFGARGGAEALPGGGGLGTSRYGTMGGGTIGGGTLGSPGGGGIGVPLRGLGEPGAMPAAPRQPVGQPYYAPSAVTAARPGGLQTVLDERQLKVTMNLVVVKLIPSAANK